MEKTINSCLALLFKMSAILNALPKTFQRPCSSSRKILASAALFSIGTICQAATLYNYFNFINIGSTNGVTNGVGGSLTISDYFGTNATVKTTATTLNSSGLAIAAGNNAGNTGVLLPIEAINGFSTNDFTIQVWYTSPAAIVANTMVFGGTTSPTQDGTMIGDQALFAGYIASYIRPIIGNNTKFGTTLNPPNGTGTNTSTLYNYVITYAAETHTFSTYMNGTLVGTPLAVTYFNGLSGLANGIAIGGVQTPAFGDNAAAVTISDFLVYSGALSAAQVSAIHTLGVGASVSSIQNALLPPGGFTWNGGGGNNNWGTGANWVGGTAPSVSAGNDLIFAGSTRTTPNMQTNYSIDNLTFSNNASSFTLGTSGGNTLTLGGSLTNNSANLQTLNLPINLIGPSIFDSGAGGLTANSNIIGGGSLTKIGSGTLTLAGANTYASVTAVNGGKLNLGASGVLPDGTTVTLGTSGTLELNAVSETIARLNLIDATFSQTNGALSLTQSGDFALRLGDTAGSTATYNLGGGSLIITNAGNSNFGGAGNGTCNQTGGSVFTTSWTVIARNSGGTGVYNISAGTLTHSNAATRIYVAENGTGTLNISGSAIVSTTGGVRVGNTGGTGSVNLNGGTLQTPLVEAGNTGASQTFYFNGGTLKANASNATFIANMDTLEVRNGGAVIDDGSNTITIAQTIAHSSVGGDNATDGGLTKLGTGTLTLSGTNSYTGSTVVSNGTLLVNGLIPGAVTVSGGVLGGTGVIAGAVTVNAGSTLSPGASVGTLTISNNLTIAGNLFFELDKSLAPGLTNDYVIVTGSLVKTGAGTLTLTNVGLPALVEGDTFQLFSQPLTGGGSLTIVPALSGGLAWSNKLAVDGTVAVIAASSAPTPTQLTNSVSGGVLSLTWPSGQNWKLQVQTNSRSVGLKPQTNQWFDVVGSTSLSSTNITIDKTQPTIFYRLAYP